MNRSICDQILVAMKKSINYNVFQQIEKFAPLKLAESWDYVGLLIEPENEVKIQKILVTNDLTQKVMDEAISKSIQMIISYHPPVFNSLKHIRQTFWKESLVTKCIKRDIYVYSPHTAFDSVHGGINDWILSVFDLKYKEPIEPFKGVLSEDSHLNAGDKLSHGSGRYCELKNPISLSKAIDLLKNHFKLSNLLLARSHNNLDINEPNIRTIAICPGSGATLLKGCQKHADLWITGEMSHHDLLDATENIVNPTSVILTCGHSNSERGFLVDIFQPWLSNELKSENIEVIVSTADADPLVVV